MKTYNLLKITFLFVAIAAFISCNNDEKNKNTDTTAVLMGEWQRSDAREMYSYKLYFNSDSEGYSTEYIAEPDGPAISNLRPFVWTSNENTVTLNYDDGASNSSPYSINGQGQLLLPGFTELPFNKL